MTATYLDHAASTTLCPEAERAIQDTSAIIGNPSATHAHGRAARAILDQSRFKCSQIFGCKTNEVLFTSGATEAINMAMIGSYLASGKKRKIWLSPLCHKSMWESAEFLRQNFDAQIELIPVTKDGFFAPEIFEPDFFSDAILIVVEHGNSELGILQPVEQIGKATSGLENPPLLIIDTAASIVTEDISLKKFKADFCTISAEKFGGPKGAGILIKKESAPLEPLFRGSQEFGLRGGTENISGIAGMARALEIHEGTKDKLKVHLTSLHQFTRDYFEKNFPTLKITTPTDNFCPHIFHFLLDEMMADLFVSQCDLEGVLISAGSACSSSSITGSRVLKNLGYTEEEAKKGIRISFGQDTTQKDLEKVFSVFQKIL